MVTEWRSRQPSEGWCAGCGGGEDRRVDDSGEGVGEGMDNEALSVGSSRVPREQLGGASSAGERGQRRARG